MQVSFVRTRGARDRIYVERDDGSTLSWVFPTYGDALPHDLVHLVVESMMGLKDGFWGRVARGLDPAQVNAQLNREGGGNRHPGFGEDKRELLYAEALAAARWRAEDSATLIAQLGPAGNPCGLPPPSEPQIQDIRAQLDSLEAQWRAFGEKGALRLQWPLRAARTGARQ